MADATKTIAVIFDGVDNISGTIDAMGKSVDSFGSDISDIGAPFTDATKQVGLMTAAIAGLAVAGLAASADIDKEAKKMAGSLGIPIEEAEKFKDIAKDVYGGGFGNDLAAAFDAVTIAQKKFGANAAVDLGKVTTQALQLQETFGTDYQESLNAVSSLMKNFGLDSQQAFDFIAAGQQKGLDGSGDFLESITEYGVQFKDGGANAGQFFSILETGFIEGVAGTDKAADAFKEFRVRIQDGSKGTADALATIGIDNAELQKNLNSGKITIADAFQTINTAIQDTNDKGVAFRAGVGLMGTQFEDMGQTAALNLDLTKTKIEDLQGSIYKVSTVNLAKDFESLYRTVFLGIADNKSWDGAKEKLSIIFGEIKKSFETVFKGLDLKDLENKIGGIWNQVAAIFKDADLDLTTVEGMQHAIDLVVESIETLIDVASGIIDILSPIVTSSVKLADGFNSMGAGTKDLIGNILGLGTALTGLGAIVSTGGKLVGGLGQVGSLLAKGGQFGTSIISAATSLGSLSVAGTTLAGAAGLGAIAAAVGVAAGSLIRLIPGVDEAAQGFAAWTDEIFNWTGTQGDSVAASKNLQQEITKLQNILGDGSTEFKEATYSAQEFEAALKAVQAAPDLTVKVSAEADTISIADTKKAIKDEIPSDEIVLIQANIDTETLDTTAKDLKEKLDPLKIIEIETNLQVEAIKAQAETIQTAIEWKAQLDIAEVEANARKVEAIMASLGTTVESTGDVISSALGALGGAEFGSETSKIESIIRDEQQLRREAFELQKRVSEEEIKYSEAKRKQLDTGTALIQVEAAGLTPALELIWQEVVAYSQVRATQEGLSLLLGV